MLTILNNMLLINIIILTLQLIISSMIWYINRSM